MPEYHHPNQEPGGEKRLFLIFGLTFFAVFLASFLLEKFAPKKPVQPVTPPAAVGQEKPGPTAPATPPKPAAAATTAKAPATARPEPPKSRSVVQAEAETETVIENGLYRITFTNRGGRVKSWILKEHKDDKGHPLDMVHHVAAEKYGYPLSLYTWDEALRDKVNSVLYRPNLTGTQEAPKSVTFDYDDGQTAVRKTFRFDHSYVVGIETELTVDGQAVSAFPAWPAGLGDQTSAHSYALAQVVYFHGDKIERKAPTSGFFVKEWVSDGNTVPGPFFWAGVSDQYFNAVFLPDEPQTAQLVEFHKVVPQNPDEPDEVKRKKESHSVLGAAVGDTTGVSRLRLFVGPKHLEALQEVRAYRSSARLEGERPTGPDLEGTADFGFFGIIAKPLFLWLRWTYDHWVPNWGWSIVFLTIIINLALFPLRYKSMKSALLQQKIKPELDVINEKYHGLKLTDPRQAEKQREVQAVMKREGISVASGCLPMLIQIPFLFAFYTMLSVANELRHAEWLWIGDLSSMDPLYILPVLITVTMYIMQKITPMPTMDAAQVKMMQILMPLMIGGISMSLPSGLCLYWVTGNVVGFGTQHFMNNSKTAKEIRAHLEKRQSKKKKKG